MTPLDRETEIIKTQIIDRRDPCVPDSKFSFKARAVLYHKWNYEVPHGYSRSARWAADLEYDAMLCGEADRLYEAWSAHLKTFKKMRSPMAAVSAVYDTPEGNSAVAEEYEE